MKTSENGRKLIEAFEGLYLKSYQDSVGVWTIGYGHTTAAGGPSVGPGQVITKEQADQLLADDLSRVETVVSQTIHVPMTQSEFDALVSFEFNTGKLRSGSIDDKINAGDKQGAMATLLQYNHAGGRVLNGLTRRRKAEKLLFEGQVDAALKLAGTTPVSGKTVAVAVGAAVTTAAATQAPVDYWPYIFAGLFIAGLAFVIFNSLRK